MRRQTIALLLLLLSAISFPYLPKAHATTSSSWLTNYAGQCLLTPNHSDSGLNSLYFIVGTYISTASSGAGCNGVGYLGTQSTADNYATSGSASVSFADSFTVPNVSQDYTLLHITGTIFLLGWLGATGSGVSYFKADAVLTVHLKVLSGSTIVNDFSYTNLPSFGSGNPGEALCANLSDKSAVVTCDSGVLQLTGDRDFDFSSQQKLSPGSYQLKLEISASSSATSVGIGGAQSSVCNTLYGWTNSQGEGCKSPNGQPAPYNGSNCLSNAGTGSSGNCFFVQWKSSSYTLTNYFPADPGYSLSVSPSSFAISTGPDTGSHAVTSTVTLNEIGVFSTGNNQIYVSAKSETGQTYWYFTIPGQTGTFAGAGVNFSSGPTQSVTLTMDPGQCNTYNDVIDVVAAFGSIVEKTWIYLSVTNNCSAIPQLASNGLSAQQLCNSSNTLACVATTTITVTNQGINWNQWDRLTARIENWTTVQNGQTTAQNCIVSSINCPWIAMNVTRTGTYTWYGYHSMLWNALPAPGGSLSTNLVTFPVSAGTGSGIYQFDIQSFTNHTRTVSQNDCTASTVSWVCNTTSVSPVYPQKWISYGIFNVTDFSITMSPAVLTIPPSTSDVSTVTVTSQYGFSGSVGLSTYTSSSRILSSLDTTSVSLTPGGTATATLTVNAFSQTGQYTGTVKGTNTNSPSRYGTLTVNVVAGADFTLCCANSYSLPQGGAIMYTGVSVTGVNGFAGPVTLSLSTTVAGDSTISLSPTSVTVSPGQYSGSTLTIHSGTQTGTWSFTITGSIGGLARTITDSITITPCCGGGGGSVAAGTLITLADGTQVPVQSLKAGMQLLSYDMTTHQYVTTTITKFVTVMTHNQMVISTSTGKPLIVDQNPAQKLYVKTAGGTVTLMSVTDLKVGYDLFEAISQTWVPITSIHYENGGNHLMYDIYTTSPGNYIANGYLDPLKT